ncbi:MAG: hypothetical protein N4A49_03660 [Marinifilaceae bacterium]|jgi:hypothetical protein|nr:hypothetical protein [Marinifilaceae bacterium]
MKRLSLILIIISIGLFSCNNEIDNLYNDPSNSNGNGNSGNELITKTSIDFGNFPNNMKISHKFIFTNDSDKDITIDSTGFFDNNFKLKNPPKNQSLKTKESIELEIENNTGTEFPETKEIQDSLYIYTDGTKHIIPIKGTPNPNNGSDFKITINSINIPSSELGKSSTGSLNLSTNYNFDTKIVLEFPEGYSSTKDTVNLIANQGNDVEIKFSPIEDKDYKSDLKIKTLFGYNTTTELNGKIVSPQFKYVNTFYGTPHGIRLGISDISNTNYDIRRGNSSTPSLYNQKFTNQASVSGNSVINTQDISLEYNDTLIIHQPENIISISFAKLKTEIPEDFLRFCINLVDAYALFYQSEIETVPEKLFANNPKILNLKYAFQDCEYLKSLPQDLLSHTTKLVNILGLFQGCTALESIPVGLFDTNLEIDDFDSVFRETKINSIPIDLFKNNTKAKTFSNTFLGCVNIPAIPANLFKTNTEVTSFLKTFMNCNELTEIPTNLFINNTKVSSFESTFEGNNKITIIGENLFPSSWTTILGSEPNVEISNGTDKVEFYKILEGVAQFKYKTSANFADIPPVIKSNRFFRVYFNPDLGNEHGSIEAADGNYKWTGQKSVGSNSTYDFLPGSGSWVSY